MNQFIPSPLVHEKIKQAICFQFSLTTEEVNEFLPPSIEIELSKNTKRIRYIYRDAVLWGMIRPNDGFFLLTPHSAKFLINLLRFPKLRVVVRSDVSEYILKGGNVFAKHVIDCDPTLIPYSEIIVVNQEDIPLAIGKALLNREEMRSLKEGIAVKVRKGI